MRLWWQLAWPWIKEHRGVVLLALFLALSTVFAGIGLLTVAGWFLTGAFLAGSSLTFNLFVPSALVRGLSMWRIASRYTERVVGHRVTLDLQAQLRTQSFAQLAACKPAQLAQYRDGDLLARLISDIERLDTFFLLIIAPAFTAVVVGGIFSLLLGAVLPVMAWVLLVILCLAAALLPYICARRTAQAGLAVQTAQADLRAMTHDAVAAHTDLVVFQGAEALQRQFNRVGLRLAQAQKQVTQAGSMGTFVQQLLMGLMVLALLWLGASAYDQQTLTAPVWVGLLLGAMGLFEILNPIMKGAAGLGAVQAAAQRLQDIAATKPSDSDQHKVSSLPEHGSLIITDLHVDYGAAAVLQAVNLSLPQGQRIAIMGPSGAGKTTLLMAIMQIQSVSAGHISYGAVDLQQVQTAALYQRFSLLSQHSPVFMGTIRHNLLLAKPEATDEELWQVLNQVRLATQIKELGGLDTWVGEGGNTLSTGQVRRLCLARTLLSDAAVWLLDEPTAGLDLPTATDWFNDLQQLAKGRTVIIVTHAILPAGVVDQVFMLQDGDLNPICSG